MTLTDTGKHAKGVSEIFNTLGSREKNMGLEEVVRTLLDNEGEVLTANKEDCDKVEAGGMNQGLSDCLRLTPTRVQAMVDGFLQVASLDDPVGEALSMKLRPSGL